VVPVEAGNDADAAADRLGITEQDHGCGDRARCQRLGALPRLRRAVGCHKGEGKHEHHWPSANERHERAGAHDEYRDTGNRASDPGTGDGDGRHRITPHR
jgi:hypothetical protein